MKIGIIGSRGLSIADLSKYLPDNISEIVSGGAKGIDTSAKKYALENHIKLSEFLPEYNKYGRSAPLKRNLQIINYSDHIVAFWDGKSKGTKHVIENCKKNNKKVTVYLSDTATSFKLLQL